MRLSVCLLLLLPLRAVADAPCDQPRPRDIAPLLTSIAQDEAMAQTFDATAAACLSESVGCDQAKLKCGTQLSDTLQKQVSVDDGTWLRDMLLPFQGQRYALMATIPTLAVAQDVSCNSDAPTLKAAAQRRKQLAQKRRDIVNEYPKWAQWTAQLAQQCKLDLASRTQAQTQATAQAQAQAQAALAAKQAEELRQKQQRDAEAAAIARAEAEKKAKEDAERQRAEALRQQQLAQAEAYRKQQEQQKAAQDAQLTAQQRAQEEARRRAEEAEAARKAEEERKKREAQAAADQKFVADREAKKIAAEKKVEDLRLQEEARRAAADKQIADAAKVDRSDERLKGSVALQAMSDYASFSGPDAGLLFGVSLGVRYGVWMTAPAQGMASGLELEAHGKFLWQAIGAGRGSLFMADPELRWYFTRFAVGATFEWRHLTSDVATSDPADTIAVGPNVAFAIVDTPDARFIAKLRWLPFVFSGVDWARLNGELEIAFKYFSAQVQAGTLTIHQGGMTVTGWFAGLGLGARLRF